MNEFEFLKESYVGYMLECFSESTGLYLQGVDLNGNVIYTLKNIKECSFCQYVKACHKERCQKSYRSAAIEASKWKEPYFFRCHAGLVMWAVPITKQGESVGALICGQVLLWKIDRFFIDELREMNKGIDDFDLLCKKAKKIKVLSPQKSQAVAQVLQAILNFLSKADAIRSLEQEEEIKWRKVILKHVEERKLHITENPLEVDQYLKKEKILLQYIRTGNKKKAMAMIATFLTQSYVVMGYSFERVQMRMNELITLISRAIVEAGLDSHIAFMESEKFYRAVVEIETVEELFEKVTNTVEDFLDSVDIMGNSKHRVILKEAKKYINNNFENPIIIEDIATEIGISGSYLSHLFKETFDYTVTDYILKVRIENAIKLMSKPELSISEIGNLSGFKSQAYFTKVFKNCFEITPQKYRNQFILK